MLISQDIIHLLTGIDNSLLEVDACRFLFGFGLPELSLQSPLCKNGHGERAESTCEQSAQGDVVVGIMLCCEELMVNIVQHSTGHIVSHTFDVHVFVKDGMAQIAVKDGGRPFDPIARGKAAKLKLVDDDIPDLGVSIAANIVSDISYKYMYGQNMVLIKV